MKIKVDKDYNLGKSVSEIKRLSSQYKKDIENLSQKLNIKQFHNLVRKIPYKQDNYGYEIVMRPKYILKRNKADCKKKAILLLAYLKAKKIPCGFSIVASPGRKQYHHVFPFIIVGGKKFDIDATYLRNTWGKKYKWGKRRDFFC